MLLTDEEMEPIRCMVVEDIDDRDMQIAKAQLRKVVEYIQHWHIGLSLSEESLKKRQALLDEVKDELPT